MDWHWECYRRGEPLLVLRRRDASIWRDAAVGTIVVNIFGSLIIGFIATLIPPDSRIFTIHDTRNFLMIGVLGVYTTFSAFSLQTINLAREGHWLSAFLNVFLSVFLCLIAVWVGHIAANTITR